MFLYVEFVLKSLLSSKSAYSNDFWRIMWHWRLSNGCWKCLKLYNYFYCIDQINAALVRLLSKTFLCFPFLVHKTFLRQLSQVLFSLCQQKLLPKTAILSPECSEMYGYILLSISHFTWHIKLNNKWRLIKGKHMYIILFYEVSFFLQTCFYVVYKSWGCSL